MSEPLSDLGKNESLQSGRVRATLIIIVAALTILFTWLSLKLISVPFISEGEETLITLPTKFKKYLNRSVFPDRFYDRSFFEKNFLVVNTTNDQELTRTKKDLVSGNNAGTPITSRKKLATLLRLLAENDSLYNIIICDVGFELKSEDTASDRKLRESIGTLQMRRKIIFGDEMRKDEDFKENVFGNIEDRNKGVVNKESIDGYLVRHQLLFAEGSRKSLPLLMFERIKGDSIIGWKKNKLRMRRQSGKYKMYNKYTPEILFSSEDFDKMKTEYNRGELDSQTVICDLGTVAHQEGGFMLRSLLGKTSGKKCILIGAISHGHADMHATLYGVEDGSIILLNIYHGLYTRYNKYTFGRTLLTLIVFGYIFYRIFLRKEKEYGEFTLGKYLIRQLNERLYYIILFIYSFVLYFLFGGFINLLATLILIEIIRGLKEIAMHYRVIKKTA